MKTICEYLLSKTKSKLIDCLELPQTLSDESVDLIYIIARDDKNHILEKCKFYETSSAAYGFDLHILYNEKCRYKNHVLEGIQFVVSLKNNTFEIVGADVRVNDYPYFRHAVLGDNKKYKIEDLAKELNIVYI